MAKPRSGISKGLIITLLMVGLFVLAYWFYSRMEWVETTVDLGFSQAARTNPYLAAEHLLNGQQLHTVTERGLKALDELPEPSATLIIAGSRRGLSKERKQQLWDWVDAGGHLITNAQAFSVSDAQPSPDDILARLDLHLYHTEKVANTRAGRERALRYRIEQGRRSSAVLPCLSEEHVVELPFEGEIEPLELAIAPGLLLHDSGEAAFSWASNADGVQFIQYKIGEGLVTIVTDLSLWSNGSIACYDHAYLLWLLTEGGSGVQVLYDADVPSLWALLWKHVPMGVLLFTALLLLWLWARSRRFGPLIQHKVSQRRQLMEHLHASASFFWRHERQHRLIDELQQSIVKTVAHRHQGYHKLESAMQSELIAKITQLDGADVHWAMHCSQCPNPQTFTRLIRVLQTIRNRL